ncbi:MAG TPA: farnesyl diphosphate synthase [Steroidobacteraceae bacterium]|nr:farnesyl diphosphate synthase [Steroidobacteraceae bacterium]
MEALTTAVDERSAEAFGRQLQSWQGRMERALAARLPGAELIPERLHAAMRYVVLGGGKRVRPALLFATALTLGLDEDEVEGAACAIELIHAYSLVHDDLPAMDDDDLRRGRPTCHRAYDEATAVLVGDALQPLAFELLARDAALPASSSIRLQLIGLLAHASGSLGMAGGQAIDLAAKGRAMSVAELEAMHERKTGALIRASVLMAAACVPALSPHLHTALESYAQAIGLAFQIQDDVLDVTGDVATLGKAVGADMRQSKPTYPALSGVLAARERINVLHEQASEALALFGSAAEPLRLVSNWLLARRN